MPATALKPRAPQQRSQNTRNALLAEATEAFTSQGYDGVSVRALEAAAKVQHGAVAYHFKNKKNLWKAAVDGLLARFASHLDPLRATILDLDEEARLRVMITAIVRFSAQTPQFSRLMVQEGRFNTWRLHYLLDTFLRDRMAWLNDMIGLMDDPHTYYIGIGAATQVFDVEQSCRELFDVDPTSDAFIKEHASRVTDTLIFLRAQTVAQKTKRRSR